MDPTTPADTRAMGIVHTALRRDLERARAALTAVPAPAGEQRRAIGRHVLWLMDFLHHHHAGEDDGLWPLVLRRDPSAAPLLDSFEADHARIAPAGDALTAAARHYVATTSDEPRAALVAALDGLGGVLFPHLDREVTEGMPVVSAALTEREWRDWDKAYNISGKSPLELGLEGHFLMDDLDPERRRVVEELVPPLPRFLLIHGFGWLYRRQARQRWQAPASARRLAART